MTIKTTTWRPDTCDCVVVYEWDDTVAEDSRVHTLVSIQKCAVHTSITPDQSAYEAVVALNIE